MNGIGSYGQRCDAVFFDVTNAVYSPGYVDVSVTSFRNFGEINAINFQMAIN